MKAFVKPVTFLGRADRGKEEFMPFPSGFIGSKTKLKYVSETHHPGFKFRLCLLLVNYPQLEGKSRVHAYSKYIYRK